MDQISRNLRYINESLFHKDAQNGLKLILKSILLMKAENRYRKIKQDRTIIESIHCFGGTLSQASGVYGSAREKRC